MIQMAAAGVTSEIKNWQTTAGARWFHIWQGMIRNMQYMQHDVTEHTFMQMWRIRNHAEPKKHGGHDVKIQLLK